MSQQCLGKAPQGSPWSSSNLAAPSQLSLLGSRYPKTQCYTEPAHPAPVPCSFSSFADFLCSGVTTATITTRRGRECSPRPLFKQQVKKISFGKGKLFDFLHTLHSLGLCKEGSQMVNSSNNRIIVPGPAAPCIYMTWLGCCADENTNYSAFSVI